MIQTTEGGGFTVTGPHLRLYGLISLKQSLILEGKGLKMSRGVSALSVAKKRLGIKGNREKIIAQVQAMIDQFTPADEEEADG